MKKSIVVILLSVFTLIGCSSKIVIEENTKNNEILNKYNIMVREIKDNFQHDYQIFEPLYFKNNNIYGINDVKIIGEVKEGEADVPMKINSKGELVENDDEGLKEFIEDPLRRIYSIKSHGINYEGFHTRDRTYYYYDLRGNIKFYLEDLDKFYYQIEDIGEMKMEEIYDLEDFYIVEIICHESFEDNIDDAEMTAKATIIIDKVNKTYYKTEINKETPYIYYFDKKENSIMALNYLGEIKKVILENESINYLDYKSINLEEIKKINLFDYILIRKYTNDNFVVLSGIYDEENQRVIQIIYDIKNERVKLNSIMFTADNVDNSNYFVVDNVDNTNYFIVDSDDGTYLSTINDEMEFELLCKLYNTREYDNIHVIGNETNVFVLLLKSDYKKSPYILEDKKYLLINIEEN